ncbi:MAG: FxLYD domain-containing protein, partial [Chloroflexota bacterium]
LAPDALLLGLISDSSYTDALDTLHVVGEIQNDANLDVGDVTIVINIYDAEGQILKKVSGPSLIYRLLPGQRAPFLVSAPRPEAMVNYSVKAVGRPISAEANAELVVIEQTTYVDQAGFYRVTGKVENRSDRDVHQPKVVATLYKRQGGVANVGFDYPEVNLLLPGQQADFDLKFTYYPSGDNYQVFAIGN